jgi:hypothetical protein
MIKVKAGFKHVSKGVLKSSHFQHSYLSTNLGQMSHLITSPCSEWTAASVKTLRSTPILSLYEMICLFVFIYDLY